MQLFLLLFLPKHTFVAVVCKQNLLRTTLQLLRLNDWWQIPSRADLHLPTQRLDSQLFHVRSASLRYVSSLESRIYYVTTPSIHRSKIQSHPTRFWQKIRDQSRPVWSNDRWLEIWPLAKVLDSDRLDSLTKTITGGVSFLKWYVESIGCRNCPTKILPAKNHHFLLNLHISESTTEVETFQDYPSPLNPFTIKWIRWEPTSSRDPYDSCTPTLGRIPNLPGSQLFGWRL